MSNSTTAREAARQHDGKFGAQHRDAVDVPLDDQPTMTVFSNGSRVWCLNDVRHRLDGPAVEYPDGTREWLVDGRHHRLDGPAVEWADGTKEFWINGRRYLTESDWRQAVEASTQTG